MTVEAVAPLTRAEELEAKARAEMARLPAADWQHRAERRKAFAYIDCILDDFNAANTPA